MTTVDETCVCVCVCLTTGYLSTVHRPDNEVVLLHVPEALPEADKNSQYQRLIKYSMLNNVEHAYFKPWFHVKIKLF